MVRCQSPDTAGLLSVEGALCQTLGLNTDAPKPGLTYISLLEARLGADLQRVQSESSMLKYTDNGIISADLLARLPPGWESADKPECALRRVDAARPVRQAANGSGPYVVAPYGDYDLSADERAEWQVPHRLSRALPGLGGASLSTRDNMSPGDAPIRGIARRK